MKTSDQIIARIDKIAAEQRAAQQFHIEASSPVSAHNCGTTACVLERLAQWAKEPDEKDLQECSGCAGELGAPNTKDGRYYCGKSSICMP